LGELALKYADSDKENSQPVSKSKNSASQKSQRSNPFQKSEDKLKDKTDAKFSQFSANSKKSQNKASKDK
jgi:hypothetical protein